MGEKNQSASANRHGDSISCSGHWTARNLNHLQHSLKDLTTNGEGTALQLEMSAVRSMDTAGAWLLLHFIDQLENRGGTVTITALAPHAHDLLDLVRRHRPSKDSPLPARHSVWLTGIGRCTLGYLHDGLNILAFVGIIGRATLMQMVHPGRIRWRQLSDSLAEAGYKALPIVGLLSFLLGIVIAYQGGIQLRQYGASLFIADLVGLSMVRELAPLITAIIVAGRTGSAYTAQIGTMQVTEELDAWRSLGVEPMELLVLPKLLALIIAMPLLTAFADVMGVLGGMVMAGNQLDLSYTTYLQRIGEAITLNSYLIGIGKTPVFAALIAIIGCYQGFKVSGSAESVGRHTTVSVVQSIFAVLVVDAAFSVAFSYLGI